MSSLPHEPDAFFSLVIFVEKFKSGDVSEFRRGGNRRQIFAFERFHKRIVRDNDFPQTRSGLLPFAVWIDVGIIAASEFKDGKKMHCVRVISANPAPRLVLLSWQQRQRAPRLNREQEMVTSE